MTMGAIQEDVKGILNDQENTMNDYAGYFYDNQDISLNKENIFKNRADPL